MPRANRYLLPGHIAHITHRCHNREFLLRFDRDRRVYRWWLWQALGRHRVSLLAYAITCNHVHLLVQAMKTQELSACIQLVHGRVGQQYLRRKGRSGAFWSDRFHVTMVESGKHLWRCLIYIELNMVRAGVVSHPMDWPWCSYSDLRNGRQRHRVLDIEALVRAAGVESVSSFLHDQDRSVTEAIIAGDLVRQGHWTESVAVGSESFVREIAAQTTDRQNVEIEPVGPADQPSNWVLREARAVYEFGPKNAL